MVQVNLRLKLSKVSFAIKVTYNTFEEATFDQYLSSSIALRSKSDEEANDYIDDISGSGSLNKHFKQLYSKAKSLTEEQLKDIMDNSMYPILKIDRSNRYDYYPQLDISVFNGKVYQGDFGSYPDLIERLYIKEKVIEKEVSETKMSEQSEPYPVLFENELIKVKIKDKWLNISSSIFQEILVNEFTKTEKTDKFEGLVHKSADGEGWFTLTNSVMDSMYSSSNYYYEKGDHCQIRNTNIRKTIISKIAGFYIYKEEIIPYVNNKEVCEKVIYKLKENKSINEFKTKALIKILTYIDDLLAQSVINYILKRKDSKELSLFGLDLLVRGIEKGWKEESLKSFMSYSDSNRYNLIYKANPKLITNIQILSNINPDFLIPSHKNEVEKYKKDIALKLETIDRIVGEVATSGLREGIKKLKSTKETKRFSKLANKYIGHSKVKFEELSMNELDKHLKQITEMQDLMKLLKTDYI